MATLPAGSSQRIDYRGPRGHGRTWCTVSRASSPSCKPARPASRERDEKKTLRRRRPVDPQRPRLRGPRVGAGIDLGHEPPLNSGGGTAPDIDRRDINLRWLGASVLTGITGGGADRRLDLYRARRRDPLAHGPPSAPSRARRKNPHGRRREGEQHRPQGRQAQPLRNGRLGKAGLPRPDDDPHRRPRSHQGAPVRPHRHEPFPDRRHLRDRHPGIQPACASSPRRTATASCPSRSRRLPTPTSRWSRAT